MMLSAGQMNDQKGAHSLAPKLPPARALIGDRGYDSNPFRAAFAERGIATRYDRCATNFFGAITLATIIIFWIGK
jgi:transposase